MEVQKIDHKETHILCPICNKEVVDLNGNSETQIIPCDHLLFVAHDMGFEYQGPRFKQYLKEEYESDHWGDWLDSARQDLRSVHIDGLILLEQIQPAPSFFGTFYGFYKK
jgi:hypothetical protein